MRTAPCLFKFCRSLGRLAKGMHKLGAQCGELMQLTVQLLHLLPHRWLRDTRCNVLHTFCPRLYALTLHIEPVRLSVCNDRQLTVNHLLHTFAASAGCDPERRHPIHQSFEGRTHVFVLHAGLVYLQVSQATAATAGGSRSTRRRTAGHHSSHPASAQVQAHTSCCASGDPFHLRAAAYAAIVPTTTAAALVCCCTTVGNLLRKIEARF